MPVVMKTTMLLFCDVDEVKLYFLRIEKNLDIIYKLCNQKIPPVFNNISENKTGYSNVAFLLNLYKLSWAKVLCTNSYSLAHHTKHFKAIHHNARKRLGISVFDQIVCGFTWRMLLMAVSPQ